MSRLKKWKIRRGKMSIFSCGSKLIFEMKASSHNGFLLFYFLFLFLFSLSFSLSFLPFSYPPFPFRGGFSHSVRHWFNYNIRNKEQIERRKKRYSLKRFLTLLWILDDCFFCSGADRVSGLVAHCWEPEVSLYFSILEI